MLKQARKTHCGLVFNSKPRIGGLFMFFNVTITYKLSPAVPVQIHKIIMLILTTPEKKGEH
jgi:hypothetical protein